MHAAISSESQHGLVFCLLFFQLKPMQAQNVRAETLQQQINELQEKLGFAF